MPIKQYRLDITFFTNRSLFEGYQLHIIEDILIRNVPNWAAKLHVWRSRKEKKTPIDISKPGVFADIIKSTALERGPLYHQLVQQFGTMKGGDRPFGTVELRGANPALIIVIRLDDWTIRPLGEAFVWGNDITFQLCKKKIESISAQDWALRVFNMLCEKVSLGYARACMVDEYDNKNMYKKGGRIFAVGNDISRYLPGIYWLNYFGKPYVSLISRLHLNSTPAYEVLEIGDGVMIRLSENAEQWHTSEYKDVETRVLDHIGHEYFFSKNNPNKRTVAPDFKLEKLEKRTGEIKSVKAVIDGGKMSVFVEKYVNDRNIRK